LLGVGWVGVVLVFFPFWLGVFGESNSILSVLVNSVWSFVYFSFGVGEGSISILSKVSFRVEVVVDSWGILVFVVNVKAVKECERGFWSCCFWKVEVRFFLVDERSWVVEDVELRLVEEEELVVLFGRQA